jgi:hypothetical protein
MAEVLRKTGLVANTDVTDTVGPAGGGAANAPDMAAPSRESREILFKRENSFLALAFASMRAGARCNKVERYCGSDSTNSSSSGTFLKIRSRGVLRGSEPSLDTQNRVR